MAWTNFASLGVGPGTTPQLDANFLAVSGLLNIPCTASGTNVLTLTQSVTTATIPGYLNYMNLLIVAAASNTGSTTANFNTFGALNIYKDLNTGPTLLTGGEIIQSCAYTLIYDSALNSGAGGFHLRNSSANLNGQAIVAQSINATFGTIASLSVTALNVSSLIATNTTISTINNTVTMGGMQMGTISNPLTRLQATLASFSFGTILPSGVVQTTVTMTGCAVNDAIVVGPPANTSVGLLYSGLVLAAGSVGIRASNMTTNSTISISSVTFRIVDIGFVL